MIYFQLLIIFSLLCLINTVGPLLRIYLLFPKQFHLTKLIFHFLQLLPDFSFCLHILVRLKGGCLVCWPVKLSSKCVEIELTTLSEIDKQNTCMQNVDAKSHPLSLCWIFIRTLVHDNVNLWLIFLSALRYCFLSGTVSFGQSAFVSLEKLVL